MIIHLSADAIRLAGTSEFTEFKVVLAADCADPDAALKRHNAGLLDGDSAIISTQWVKANAADSASAAWQSGFSGMLAYAGTKAHLEAAS